MSKTNHTEQSNAEPLSSLGPIEYVNFSFCSFFFKLLCYKVKLETSNEQLKGLWKSKVFKPCFKALYQIAFFPYMPLQSYILVLKKSTKPLLERMSDLTSIDLYEDDLLNSKTMLEWIQICLQSYSDEIDINSQKKLQLNPLNWNVKSNHYFICQSATRCWRCKQTTPVYAIVLPSESFTWWEVNGRIIWIQEQVPGILQNITEFSENSFQPDNTSLHTVFYKDFSKAAGYSYWMNHCTHCSIKLGDSFLHHPGEAFWPLSIPAAKELKVYKHHRPIEARCDRVEFPCFEDVTIG